MTGGELIEQALSDSILVVAHPDDELLWFGSVASFVQKIVICFLNDPVNPGMAEARRNTLSDHPWRDRIVCLELDETNAFSHADWPTPSPSRFGLRIVKPRQIRAAYRLCYRKLHKRLAPIVRNA